MGYGHIKNLLEIPESGEELPQVEEIKLFGVKPDPIEISNPSEVTVKSPPNHLKFKALHDRNLENILDELGKKMNIPKFKEEFYIAVEHVDQRRIGRRD
jgi:hypothetical protein